MVATVRLDATLEKRLESLANTLHKKKSDIIREAITFYANTIDHTKKSRLIDAVQKTKNADLSIYKEMEGTLNDGI